MVHTFGGSISGKYGQIGEIPHGGYGRIGVYKINQALHGMT